MFHGAGGFYNLCKPTMQPLIEVCVYYIFHGAGGFYNLCKPSMKPLMEVCVYVPWGREIMTRECYDKEIPWHWDDGANGLLAPLSGMAFRAIPSSSGYCYMVHYTIRNDIS